MRRFFFMLGCGAACLLAYAAPAAAQDKGYYVVALTLGDVDESSPQMQEVLAGHIGHLGKLYDQGVLFMAGPFDDDAGDGIAIVQAYSAEEARGFFETDPSVAAGLMHIDSARPWWAAFSRPDGRVFTMKDLAAMMQGEGETDAVAASVEPEMQADAAELEQMQVLHEAGYVSDQELAAAEAEQALEAWEPIEGAIVHAELPSLNLEESAAFYGPLFGWEFIPESEEYSLFMTPDAEGLGGGFSTEAPVDHGSYVYIYSADIDAKLAEIEAAGGSVFMPKTPIPGFGWFALFQDPHGNVVGLFSATTPPPAEQ